MRSSLLFGLALLLPAVLCYPTLYNEEWAQMMMRYTCAANCVGDYGTGVDPWVCPTCGDVPALTVTQISNSRYNANCYVGYDEANNRIIIAFGGSQDYRNWLANLNFRKVKYPHCEDCKVHAGFYHSYMSLQDDLMEAVEMYLLAHPDASVHLTGHSLGSAMATYCAVELAAVQGVNVSTNYLFATPRAGNSEFADFVMEHVDGHFRITHHKDPVPHTFPKLFGYRHTAPEVWYPDYQNIHEYTYCDEPESRDCAKQFLIATEWEDHTHYMDIAITDAWNGCKLPEED